MTKHANRRGAAPIPSGSHESRLPEGNAGYRHARLTRLIHEELEALVRDDLDDPGLATVRLTHLELSVDYKNARVGFVSDKLARERASRGLLRATPLLRARLAEAIDLKTVPALRFVWDSFAAASPEAVTSLAGAGAAKPLGSEPEEIETMRYEKPEVAEIKMDAEIGSYQNDFDPVPVPEFVELVGRAEDDRAE